MMQITMLAFELAQERREREIADAIEHRRIRARQREVNPVRVAVGRSIIAIGARLAGEPQPRLARSR
jgi:hypothetical protein